jgi:hypothetical protein
VRRRRQPARQADGQLPRAGSVQRLLRPAFLSGRLANCTSEAAKSWRVSNHKKYFC